MLRNLCFVFTLTLLVACGGAPEGDVTSIAPKAVATKLGKPDQPLLLDVRSPEEFASGHLPGSINIPYQQVGERTEEIFGNADTANGIVVYCAVGPRARKAEAMLLQAGYDGALMHMDGGVNAWHDAGLPEVR